MANSAHENTQNIAQAAQGEGQPMQGEVASCSPLFTGRPVKRVTLFAGHYGSGKTNLAVNYALALAASGKTVKIADLDIVNPYFRTKDSERALKEAGVTLISPTYANTSVDLPALPQEAYALVMRRDAFAVMDIGGDDRGAYALGRYAPYLVEENDYEMAFVVNFYRPLSRTAEEAYQIMKEIEAAAHLPFTVIVNNSNVGEDTTAADLLKTASEAQKLSELCGLPAHYYSAKKDVAREIANAFPLTLQEKYF